MTQLEKRDGAVHMTDMGTDHSIRKGGNGPDRTQFGAQERPDADAPLTTSQPRPCPTDSSATIDADGWCSVHEWNCADYAMFLDDEDDEEFDELD